MPCGALIEIVQVAVRRHTDVEISDHADLEIRVLPVLPRERLIEIIREELVARGWEPQPDGSLTKPVGEATATLPPGSTTVRITLSDGREISVSASATQQIAQGDEKARDAVNERVEADAARKLEALAERTRRELEEKAATRLIEAATGLRAELDEVVNATTRRALEQRASELGSIESIQEGRGDNGYELTITVRT